MSDELARLVIGLPVAVLFPWGIPGVRERRLAAALLSVAYGAFVLAPTFPEWRAWLLLAASPFVSLAVASVTGAANSEAGPNPPHPPENDTLTSPIDSRALAALVVGSGVAVACVAGAADAVDAVSDVLSDDHACIVVSGLVAAVFVAGMFISAILGPFTQQLAVEDGADHAKGLARAGTYIGWLERALFFAFIVAGEPQAAAIALAAKSVARFPALQQHQEGFAEYFLIGSLASVTFATAIAIGTRAALGLPAV